jgi:hypothetical protein
MNDKLIELPLVQKKPYVRPQLHELTGENADGKGTFNPAEFAGYFGPS